MNRCLRERAVLNPLSVRSASFRARTGTGEAFEHPRETLNGRVSLNSLSQCVWGLRIIRGRTGTGARLISGVTSLIDSLSGGSRLSETNMDFSLDPNCASIAFLGVLSSGQ